MVSPDAVRIKRGEAALPFQVLKLDRLGVGWAEDGDAAAHVDLKVAETLDVPVDERLRPHVVLLAYQKPTGDYVGQRRFEALHLGAGESPGNGVTLDVMFPVELECFVQGTLIAKDTQESASVQLTLHPFFLQFVERRPCAAIEQGEGPEAMGKIRRIARAPEPLEPARHDGHGTWSDVERTVAAQHPFQ